MGQSVTPRQGARGCREETVGKDLLPAPLRLLPATQAALARASRSAQPREARQQASLTLSNKHDGSAGGFWKVHSRGTRQSHGATERGTTTIRL